MKESQTPHNHKTYARSSEKRNRRLENFPNFNKAQHNSQNLTHFLFRFAFLILHIQLFMFIFIFIFGQITNKCLNAALTSISEASVDSSPISEISCANRSEEVTISSLEEALPETLLPSDVTPSKKIAEEEGIGSAKCFNAYELDSAMFTSTELEIAAIDLSNAKPKVLNSHDAASQYKKLMDEITKYVLEDLYMNTVPKDLDWSYQGLYAKNRMVFLCFCIWIIGVLAIFFFASDSPYCGALPT
ncbi:hypothetical protein E2542_SST18665 [Spatholobus suberectus]|nr:hypothetical protein E2542_SST18665 [Spatholobus suberectus]